jgi:hypothetical protein
MFRLVAALLILMAAAVAGLSSASAFRWIWDRPAHRHHHARPAPPASGKGQATPFAEPKTDCPEILDAQKKLDGPDSQRWKKQLGMLTDGQRANIAKCLDNAP